MVLTKYAKRRRNRQFFRDLALRAVEAAADGDGGGDEVAPDGAAGNGGGGGVDVAAGAAGEDGGGVVGAGRGRRRRRGGAGRGRQRCGAEPPPNNEGKPAKENRMSKKQMQKQGLGRDVTANLVPDKTELASGIRRSPLRTRVEAIQEAETANNTASELNEHILNRVRQLSDEETTFRLYTNCSVQEYNQFLDQLHMHSLRIAPFTIPVVINGVEVHVPVTPLKPPNVEDYTYHTIILVNPFSGTEIYILVEDFSGYIKAIKIVLPSQDPSTKKWHRFGRDPLPSRYMPFDDTHYGDGYGSLASVYFNSAMFLVIFEFFLSFDADESPEWSTKGERILNTSYIAFGEAPRFLQAKLWVGNGLLIGSNMYHFLPRAMTVLLRDWGLLSKAIFSLYLALLEQRMVNQAKPIPDANKSMRTARLLWRDAQDPNKIIKFFHRKTNLEPDQTPIFLEHLCESQLTLLRHDYTPLNKVQLRLSGYTGYFEDDIEEAYAAGKLT